MSFNARPDVHLSKVQGGLGTAAPDHNLGHESMKDLQRAVDVLRPLLWAPLEDRKFIQRHGFNVLPVNFYSSTPSIEEIRDSFEYREPAPYMNESLFDPALLASTLRELLDFSHEMVAPDDDSSEAPSGFFWNNSQFSYSDAAAYYAFIRLTKPKRIVEIGSGFSTLVASAAIGANGFGEIHCVEPFPRPFLKGIRHVTEVVEQPVQSIDVSWFNKLLRDDDMLFVDSTHTVKIGSDCLHIYLRLLPALKHRLLVHVHDIFLPAALPQEWALDLHIYWTEQYLLLAYLLDNPKVRVLFGSKYHLLLNPEILRGMTPGNVTPGGSSFWFELDPSPAKP